MMSGTHTYHPAITGTVVALGSGAYSFFGTTLVIVQWLAAVVAIGAGLLTIAHLIKHWKKPR